MSNLIEVKLIGIIMDPVSKTPVMILKPLKDRKIIPIWIGTPEANAITMELESIATPRPMTHDLIKNILYFLDVKLLKIVVTDIVENTYYAELHLRKQDEDIVIDSRPSDAIALAIKNSVKIYISESVYNNCIMADYFPSFIQNEERLEKWFDSLLPEDFGNVEQ